MPADRVDAHLRNHMLANLPGADMALLAGHLESVTLQQGVLLHQIGEPVEQIYFPHSGMVSLLAVLPAEQPIEIATVGREGVVGAMLILGSKLSPNRSLVQVAGAGSRIAVRHLNDAFDRSASIRHAVLGYNEVLLSQIQTTAVCNALHGIEARLARWILQTGDRIGGDVIPLTQEFLSQMLGVQRTSVTLIARTFQTAGLIRYSRGQIRILDRDKLERIACECYRAIRDHINHPPSES